MQTRHLPSANCLAPLQVASVGKTEEQVKEEGVDYKVRRALMQNPITQTKSSITLRACQSCML